MDSGGEKERDRFYAAVLSLRTAGECRDFFADVATIRELDEMAKRFSVACMLEDRKRYQEIHEETGVSAATISRVNRCLNYGSGGYMKAIARLRADRS